MSYSLITDEQVISIDPHGRSTWGRLAKMTGWHLAKHYRVEQREDGALILTPVALPTERWVPCVGYPNYELSDQGRCRRIEPHQLIRIRAGSTNPRDGAAMVRLRVPAGTPGSHAQNVDKGYDNHYVWRSLGPLVLESFGQPKPFPEAIASPRNVDNHDCSLKNLRWASR